MAELESIESKKQKLDADISEKDQDIEVVYSYLFIHFDIECSQSAPLITSYMLILIAVIKSKNNRKKAPLSEAKRVFRLPLELSAKALYADKCF